MYSIKKTTCVLLIMSLTFPCGLWAVEVAIPSVTMRLKALYRAQDTLPKLIEDESVPEQRMDDYYVDLQLDDNQGPEGRRPIAVENMFEGLDKKVVLIVGGAGIGKSTLLHHIAYEWGTKDIFGGLFEYVFTVKLKKLATERWKSLHPSTTENPLELLVFESLYEQQEELKGRGIGTLEGIDLEEESVVSRLEVMEHLKKEQRSKVLLLLDGYDEVAALSSQRGSMAKTIIDKIFTYPNVVLTSRPNALTSDVKQKFARQIESKGLSGVGVEQYINQYFKEEAEARAALIGFSRANPAIQDAMATPINAVMICLISRNPDFMQKFGSTFPLGSLYDEVVVWLGRRYMMKFPRPGEDFSLDRISSNRVYSLPEVRTLSQMAYESFIAGNLSLTGEEIDGFTIGSETDLDHVIRYGLIRSNTAGTDIMRRGYSFIHLSFQEYMTALVLRGKLGEGRDTAKTAMFVGQHRHEPRYLMTLKLLAGIMREQNGTPGVAVGGLVGSRKVLAMTDGPGAGRSDDRLEGRAFPRFWESVICNVDGVLEFGVANKVQLLMHLLGQTSSRDAIPHFAEVQEFIDRTVLSDLTRWRDVILQSGYVSREMARVLMAILTEAGAEREPSTEGEGAAASSADVPVPGHGEDVTSTANIHQQRVAIDIITTLINKKDLWERSEIFKRLMDIVRSTDNWQLRALSLGKLSEILDESIPVEERGNLLKMIFPFLQDTNYVHATKSLLIKVVQMDPEKTSEVLGLFRPLFSDEDESVRVGAMMSFGVIAVEIVKTAPERGGEVLGIVMPLLSHEDYKVSKAAKESFKAIAVEIVKTAPERLGEVLGILTSLFSDKDGDVRYAATESFKAIVPEVLKTAPERGGEVLGIVTPLLSHKDWDVRSSAVESFGTIAVEIVKTAPERGGELLGIVMPLLSHENQDIRYYTVGSFGTIAVEVLKTAPDRGGEILGIVTPLLSHENKHIKCDVVESFEEIAVEILKTAPERREEILGVLMPLLSDEDEDVRDSAAGSFGAISVEIVKTAPARGREVLGMLMPLLSDAYARVNVLKSFKAIAIEIIKTAPERAGEVLGVLMPLLSDEDEDVRRVAAESFGPISVEIVKTAPERAGEVLGIVTSLFSDKDEDVRSAAVWSFGEITREILKTAPERGGELLGIVTPLLSDENEDVRRAAVWSFRDIAPEIVKTAPERGGELLGIVTPLLSDKGYSVRSYAVWSFGMTAVEIVKTAPERGGEVLGRVIPLFSDKDGDVVSSAAESFEAIVVEILKTAPERGGEVLGIVTPLLSDEDKYVRSAAVGSFGVIAVEILKTAPERGVEVLGIVTPRLSDENEWVRSGALESFKEIAVEVVKTAPERVGEFLRIVMPLFSDEDEYVRSTAARSCDQLIQSLSDLGVLAPLLIDEKIEIRNPACQRILSVLKDPTAVEGLTHKDVMVLLKVIQSTTEEDDLNKLAKEALKRLGNRIDEEGVVWLNERFSDFPSLPATTDFLKEVCPHLLKDGTITDVEADFIINCIHRGVTVMITREDTILFEGKPYKLSKEDPMMYEARKKLLNKITIEALNQEEDPLAKQYRDYDPMFPNSGIGLRRAASDIKEVRSLAGEELLTNQWQLTVLSPYHPTITEGGFVLLEKRSPFGDRMTYKISMKGGVEQQEEGHPEDTQLFRNRLFAGLDPSVSYVKKTKLMDDAEVERLLTSREDSAAGGAGESKRGEEEDDFGEVLARLLPDEGERIVDLIDLRGIDRESYDAHTIRNSIAAAWAGVHDEATIKKGLQSLDRGNPHLRAYAKTFYWTIADFLESYRVASTSVMQGNTEAEITERERTGIWFAQKAISMGESIPIFGSVAGILGTIIDEVTVVVEENRFSNKVNSMCRVIRSKCRTTNDITNRVIKASLEIIKKKKKEIISRSTVVTTRSPMGRAERVGKWIQEKIEEIKEKILPSIDLDDPEDKAAQLALEDATLTLAYLVQNYEAVIRSPRSLEDQIVSIVMEGGLGEVAAVSGDLSSGTPAGPPVVSDTTPPKPVACARFLARVTGKGRARSAAQPPEASPGSSYRVYPLTHEVPNGVGFGPDGPEETAAEGLGLRDDFPAPDLVPVKESRKCAIQ